MKTIVFTAWAVAFAGLPAIAATDPMAEICHVRAEKGSGYDGPRQGLSKEFGNVRLRFSGSVSIGVSRTNGPQGGFNTSTGDRSEDKARDRYFQIYDACMDSR